MAADRVGAVAVHLTAAATGTDARPLPHDPQRKPVATSPYLHGNFGPISTEVSAEDLPVLTGRVPRDVDGQYVRNGPNPQFDFSNKPYFWFDGDGMLHAIRIHNGKASFVNRFIRTERFVSDAKHGTSISELAELSHGNMVMGTVANDDGERMGKANTALAFYNRRVFALEEGDKPYVIKLPSLDTVGRYTFEDQLSHSVTAHPLVDAKTGEMMFFGYTIQPTPPYVQYSFTDAQGKLVRTVPINIREDAPVMMHSFAITEHYSIVMDLPLRFMFSNFDEGKEVWDFQEVGSRFGILPRHADDTSEVKWFDAETCMIFHTANAWEEGDEVVLIACRSRHFRFEGLNTLMENTKKPKDPAATTHFHEYRFNMRTGAIKERKLSDEFVEFPVIPVHLTGYRVRYVYAARFVNRGGTPYMDGVVKLDLATGRTVAHSHQGLWGGECVFVPRQNAKSEDDGYLVTFLHDERTNASQFVMIDALTMAPEAVCRIATPQRVPFGFHGAWFTQQQIDAQAV